MSNESVSRRQRVIHAAVLVATVAMMGTCRSVIGGEGKAVRAYMTNFGGDGGSVIDVPGGRFVGHIETGRKPHGVALSSAGNTFFVSNEGDETRSVHGVKVGDRCN